MIFKNAHFFLMSKDAAAALSTEMVRNMQQFISLAKAKGHSSTDYIDRSPIHFFLYFFLLSFNLHIPLKTERDMFFLAMKRH